MANILVVEDDPLIAKTMRIVLSSADHFVTTLDNIEDGLRHIELHPVDLLITDVSMPGGSGIDLLNSVRAKHARVKVLVMSGSQSSLEEARSKGADVALEKPFASEDLHKVIAALLGDRG